MSKRTMAVCAALGTVLAATLFTPVTTGAAAGSPSPTVGSAPRPATAGPAVVDAAAVLPFSAGSLSAALASAALTPAQAVAQANSNAAANGINTHISVTDARTGAVLAQTGNAGTQVASESVVKLMTAAYYLVIVGGYQNQSQSVLDQLSFMIRYSDDQTENDYFTSAAVPTIAARYGMGSTINATDRVGHWGAVRITARDMTTFLYRAFHDPQVGPWLQPVMAQVAPVGSDGFNQAFGMNSLSGAHGSKQGWGNDQFWTSASNVINSVGYTDRFLVAILQNSYSFPDPARGTSTLAARAIQASRVAIAAPPPPPPPPVVPRNGDFVSAPGVPGIYRLAGGAPIYVSSWAPFGRVQAVKKLTAAQWNALRKVPANGTFITATGTRAVYRIAGGAPLYVSNWAQFGGVKPTVVVDGAAVFRAGRAGVWSHLLATPVDGTFLTASGNHQVFRVVAGTPTYVTTWRNWGGVRPTTLVDGAVFTHAGQPGFWSHLRNTLPDNTFIVGVGSGEIYRMAGGAPIFVSSWAAYGRVQPFQYVDAGAITKAGTGGQFQHLLRVPANGTFIKAGSGGATYRIAGGAPLYVRPLTALATNPVVITVDRVAVANAGKILKWSHLRRFPVDNTILRGVPGNRVYRVTNGYALRFTSGAGAVAINQSTIDLHGSGGYFASLR
ncbi:hypothetical protein ABIB25_004580 [Nakamurella sp. UYEF19]|uniref:hypothetical protein n=1 Tax=Nakamurella sp. UYEF19 TaxID=1756392 RepID=UPI0033958904